MESHRKSEWIGRAILHVDMDAFFASVEQLDHPEYRGRPVIVGGSPEGRGVVSAASYEARKFGVHSAMPSARAAVLCPDAIWARPHFDRYHEISDAVLGIFRDFTPLVQPISIDEAFVDVSPTAARPDSPVDIANSISQRVDQLGVTCSIGVSSTKTVSKIASDFNKPHGITVVPPGEEAEFLRPLSIDVMSGIGAKTGARLRTFGIKTLGDLASLDEATAAEILGSMGSMLVSRAKGIDSRAVHENDPRKSVSNERTFGEDVRDAESIRRAASGLVEKVARRLRRSERAGRTITVKVRFTDFTTRTAQRTLDRTTDDEGVITACVEELIASLWHPGVGVRLLGVGVSGFDSVSTQMDLLESTEPVVDDRRRTLVESVDALRDRFGDEALGFGSSGLRRDDSDES